MRRLLCATVTETVLYKMRSRIADKLRRAEAQGLQKIGDAEVYRWQSTDPTTISNSIWINRGYGAVRGVDCMYPASPLVPSNSELALRQDRACDRPRRPFLPRRRPRGIHETMVSSDPSTPTLTPAPNKEIRLDASTRFELVNARLEFETYRGLPALRLAPQPDGENVKWMLALVPGIDFTDGTIEVDVAGVPHAGAAPDMRGFIGIAFRAKPHGEAAEYFYVRPTNARANDQLVRNHSTQYMSEPEFPWQRLRAESPGVYEAYADMEAGAWTHLKIVVSGVTAKLHVNGADAPCLVVNDLKLGESHGQVALWANITTIAHFANLSIR